MSEALQALSDAVGDQEGRPHLDRKEPTFLGFLIMISLYESLKW